MQPCQLDHYQDLTINENGKMLIEMMEQSEISVADIVNEFEGLLEDDRVLTVYVYGSRLYGKTPNNCQSGYYSITPDSDFDIMMIYDFDEDRTPAKLTFLSNQKENKNSEFMEFYMSESLKRSQIENCDTIENRSKITYRFTIKRFGLDMCIYSKSQFLNQVKKHQFSELIGFFLEQTSEYEKFILRNRFRVSDEFLRCNSLDLSILRSSFSQSASMCWKCAKSMYDHRLELDAPEVEVFKGKKTIIHALRVFHFGIQIAQSGKITDWHCCDKYYDDVLQSKDKYETWGKIIKIYQPIRTKLHEHFKSVASKETENDH